MRKIAKTLLVILGVAVVAEVAETVLMVWAFRSRNPRALRLIRRFNKQVRNPVTLRFSGRSGLSATVHHVGRRSGTPYATPVIAHRSHQDVIIPLPYGTEVDWLRNVQAAGQAMVDLDGRTFRVDQPALVDIDDAVGLLPASMVRITHLHGTRHAVRLRVSGVAAAASA
jgi:deazaflavin-dependent oxidoreductase (nitroreductase family)